MTDGDPSAGSPTIDTALEAADDAARARQIAGVDPLLRPVVAEVGGLVVRAVAGWPDSPLSSITGLSADRLRSLDPALGLLARLGVTHPIVSVVVPVAGDVDPLVVAALTERGFTPAASLVRLVCDLATTGAPDPGGFRVEEVGPERAAAVVAVCRAGFGASLDPAWWRAGLGRDGWTQVLAYDDDGTPVATGALSVSGNVGWIGAATTVPTARRRGAHRAVLGLRLSLAADAGASRVGVLVAGGGASQQSLERAGFTTAHPVQQWRRPPV